ncbi:hypothetical protein JYK02_26415 [Corallococcus macrosporus]|uniref:Uncharacterized protein n=1 Tax=Corallococcus macrosporus TaxID=35 RepID=A0ABS3DIA6_9BACT|nr:hypothetical protein [Corallococcus macrosporus]MBN8231059.1 hypothetical protein [Corallococcus macrosporus]
MLVLPDGRVIRSPSATIPLELFGTKISVTTNGGGAKVSIKLEELGKYLAREYLGRYFPTGWVTDLLKSFVDVKTKCNAALSYNYKRPKREGLHGLMMDATNNAFGDLQGALLGVEHGPLELWNTVEDLSGTVRKWKPTDPIRACTAKVVAGVVLKSKVAWLPIDGTLKINYSVVYEEYVDRIEVHLADIKVAGGLKYHARLDVPRLTTVVEGMDRFSGQYPLGGTMALPSSVIPTSKKVEAEPLTLEGASKIKQLSFKQEIEASTFTWNRRTGAVGISGFVVQNFQLVLLLVLIFFIYFRCSYMNLSKLMER